MNKIEEFVKFNELDEDGQRIIGSMGIFKTVSNLFTPIWDGYTLTNEGWKYYESIGLKHPGRGWVEVIFLSREDIEKEIKSSENHLIDTQNHIESLKNLLH